MCHCSQKDKNLCIGKSSLVIQFIENHFVESYYPTIESTFAKSVNYKGVEYDCDIIDTAGQVSDSQFFYLVPAYLKG